MIYRPKIQTYILGTRTSWGTTPPLHRLVRRSGSDDRPAIRLVEECDIFVVIGTSLNVYPAAGLLNYVRRGQPIYLIDPKEVKAYRDDICFIRKGASEGVKELKELLLQNH